MAMWYPKIMSLTIDAKMIAMVLQMKKIPEA